MDQQAEKKLIERMKADAPDDAAWECEEPDPRSTHRRMGAQVSVRFSAEYAAQLRAIAERDGVGYTSLVRSWIEERIDSESQTPTFTPTFLHRPIVAAAAINEPIQIAGGHLVDA